MSVAFFEGPQTVSIRHPGVNGGEWLEERSDETAIDELGRIANADITAEG